MSQKFTIKCLDGTTLLCVPHHTDNELIEAFRGFPEFKWRRIGSEAGWAIGCTKENLDYLYRTFDPSEYIVTSEAKTLISFETLTVKVDELKARRRWEYIFNETDTKFDYVAPFKPFMHQRVAVEAAYGAEYFGHLMEMGTGKTKAVCDECLLYMNNLKQGEIFRCVIVAPKALRKNWQRELHMHIPDIHSIWTGLLDGDLKALNTILESLNSGARGMFYIVSYDSVDTMIEQLEKLRPTMVVFDESHYCKNPESKRWKAAKRLTEACTMKRILTGTPVSNNILDVWSQFELLRPGCLGYSTYLGFKRAFCKLESRDANNKFDKIVGYKDVDKLKEAMARCSFIIRKDQCLDLPEQIYSTRYIDMPETVRESYDKFATEFYATIDGKEVSTEYIIVQMLKLSQICCGHVGATTIIEGEETTHEIIDIVGGDAKLNQMIDDAVELVNSGRKLLIWSRFRHDNQKIHRALNERGIWNAVFDGGTKDKDRQEIVDAFNQNDDFRIMICNAGSGGVGLTLLGTPTVPCCDAFFFSNDFSYGKRLQAEGRNHRIGQKHKVTYTDYCYSGSIEEFIAAKLREKKDISDSVKNVGEIKDFLLNGRI